MDSVAFLWLSLLDFFLRCYFASELREVMLCLLLAQNSEAYFSAQALSQGLAIHSHQGAET